MNLLNLINRKSKLFLNDLHSYNKQISEIIKNSNFLIIGAAGTIGKAVSLEVFSRNPKKLHVVDISENNLVELVRHIRSSYSHEAGDFQQYAIDADSQEFEQMINVNGPYDYVLNLSALKHVRSEKDPYTLMRMIKVNIFNTLKTLEYCNSKNTKKYFCVSSDKAANPSNLMGATKRIMELFLLRESEKINVSTARFANVAFSDGSLLYGFNQRFQNNQPITAPEDINRYFITPEESGELCLFSTILGENRETFFPKLDKDLNLISFSEIAKKFILSKGFEPYECQSEDEARSKAKELISKKKWPCLFFKSDTTGEKAYEEFFTEDEKINLSKFSEIGIIENDLDYNNELLEEFLKKINSFITLGKWSRNDLKDIISHTLPELSHKETGKFLDSKM